MRRYLGTWTLPSGNSADVYLDGDRGPIEVEWDAAPSPDWPAGDVEHYRLVIRPAIERAMTAATGRRVLTVEV